mmetsp:Transcript_17383/g.30284  ORF Transcript_17383/g.30284 Transcript_17383/m.30284 type:complete len:116 (-) Transcript_17383:200-547(-)
MFLRFVLLLALVTVAFGRLGGWESTDPEGNDVVRNVQYALKTAFPDLKLADFAAPNYKVTSAKKKVVAGMLYDITVEFTPPEKTCAVHHFEVQLSDRTGKLNLLVNEVMETACSA